MRYHTSFLGIVLAGLLTTQVDAANIYGLKPGHPDLKSATVLSFGPDGILFIGDAQGATIYAVGTQDSKGENTPASDIPQIDQKIAKQLNVDAKKVKITDLAVNPETQNVFLAVQVKGQSPKIFKLEGKEGKLAELDLQNIEFSQAALPNAAEDKEVGEGRRRRNNRGSAITDLAFVDGQLMVAGLSNDQSASNVWSLMFPFQKVDKGTSLEYYHGAHGRKEDYSPIRTFVPFIVNGEPNLLAGFVCTPLVKFPVSKLVSASEDRATVQGTTVAELGNRNKPLDMIAYQKNGKDYLLLANSARGVMKISTEGIDRPEGITSPIRGGKTSGQKYETIDSLEGTVQLDKFNDSSAVVLQQDKNGQTHLKIVPLP